MPIVLKPVYERDALDERMAASGWINAEEAAILLKRSLAGLAASERAGELVKEPMHGRTYYPQEDIVDMLHGRSPSVRRHAEQEACWRVHGYPEPSKESPRTEPGSQFLSKFGGKKS